MIKINTPEEYQKHYKEDPKFLLGEKLKCVAPQRS